MKISSVLVKLSGDDILSIIEEFVEVEGLELHKVNIDNGIEIEGSFIKGIKLNFKGTISELEVVEGKVHCRFSSFKIYKLGIIRVFRSLGVKMLLKFIGDLGFEGTKDKLIIDVNKVLEIAPMVKLNVTDIYTRGDILLAEVANVDLDLKDIINKDNSKEEKKEEETNTVETMEAEIVEERKVIEETIDEEDFNSLIIENKTEDYYSKGRVVAKERLDEKLPPQAKKFSDYILVVPDLIALIGRLLKDERVPMKTKLTVSGSVAYILFPSDLIPSKIPFIGQIDDIAVLFFALNRIAKDVPLNVIVENWSGKNELIVALKDGLDYVINFTGAKNLDKIFNVVEELSTL